MQRVWSMTLAHWTRSFRAGSDSGMSLILVRRNISWKPSNYVATFGGMGVPPVNHAQDARAAIRLTHYYELIFFVASATDSELICAILATVVLCGNPVKEKLLQYLSCPTCAGTITLASAATTEADEIIEGRLSCISSAHSWPVVRGVPRFASPRNGRRRQGGHGGKLRLAMATLHSG